MSLRVVEVRGLALVQDMGRAGHMHEGLATGGAMVVSLLWAANAAVENARSAAAIELHGELTLEATAEVDVATEDGVRSHLKPGDRLRVPSRPDLRVRYVALAGGVDAPALLGGRGTSLVAGLGRPLARGDSIAPAPDPLASEASRARSRPTLAPKSSGLAPIRVVPGPDLARCAPGALAALFSAPLRISSRSDRVGTRLEGLELGRRDADDARSCPMVRGAIEVPASGELIVLGPDHPTTGGYPIVAVVSSLDQDAFFSRPLGGEVRFCER